MFELLIVALGFFTAWRVTRGGAGSAVQELTAANKVLEHRKDELGAEVRDLKAENAALKARTDYEASLTAALGPLAEALGTHERGARERSEALLKILDERLPHGQ